MVTQMLSMEKVVLLFLAALKMPQLQRKFPSNRRVFIDNILAFADIFN